MMLIRFCLRRTLLVNSQKVHNFNKSINYSTDYSKLKPVDLSFYKFESKNPNQSKPVLIYHGLFGSKNNWRSLGRMICDRTNRDTYVFDVRNHGESPHDPDFTYPIIANDVRYFMNKNKIDQAALVGHSLGGRAFSKFSFMFPELVERLVVVDVHPTHQIPANEYLSLKFCNILKEAAESIKNNPEKLTLSAARKFLDDKLKQQIPDSFLRQFFLSSLCERDGQIDWRFNFPVLTEFLVGQLNKITIDKPYNGPSLLVYGGSSVYFDESHFESVLEIFPKMRFEMIEGANHYLHISHHKEFLDLVVPFLNEK